MIKLRVKLKTTKILDIFDHSPCPHGVNIFNIQLNIWTYTQASEVSSYNINSSLDFLIPFFLHPSKLHIYVMILDIINASN